MARMSWEQYFLTQAYLMRERSTCTRLKVGSVIVKDNRLIASGYNGSVSGDDHCIEEGCYVVKGHCVRTIHSEENAILQSARYGISTNGCSIYVTHFPCLKCTKMIIQSGITKVFYCEDYRNDEYAERLLKNSNVEVKKIELENVVMSLK